MRKIAWVLLLLFAFAIPWEYSLDLGEPLGNIARIVGLFLLLAAIPAVLQAGRLRTPGPLQWMVLAFYLWFCCSYFWTIEPQATLERIRGFFQEMMIVWLVWEFAESPRDLRSLLCATVAGSWVLAALTLANFASPEAIAAGQIRFVAEGQDPNDAARYLDLGFPLAALLLNSESRWPARLLALGYLPLGLVAVLLTASREGFVAAVVALAGCALLLARSHARGVIAGILALPVIAAALWFYVPHQTFERLATIPAQLQGGDLNQRLNIWRVGWHAFVQAPWFGAGAGSFVRAAALSPIDTAHNTVLSILVSGGLCKLMGRSGWRWPPRCWSGSSLRWSPRWRRIARPGCCWPWSRWPEGWPWKSRNAWPPASPPKPNTRSLESPPSLWCRPARRHVSHPPNRAALSRLQRQSPHLPRCRLGRRRGHCGQDRRHLQGDCRGRRLWPDRRHGCVPCGCAGPRLADQPDLRVDEPGAGAHTGPGEETGGPRSRPATAVEFDAVDVRIANRSLSRHGSHGARFFPPDCVTFSGRQARPLGAALLRSAAGGAHHRNRYQLYRRSEYLRPLCSASAGSRDDLGGDHRWRADPGQPLRHLGHGLLHPGRFAGSCGCSGVDDGLPWVPLPAALVRNDRGHPRSGAPVWDCVAGRRGGLGRPAGGPVNGRHAAGGERLRAGLCQPLCERGSNAAGGGGFNGRGALLVRHDRRSGLGRLPSHPAHLGTPHCAGFRAHCNAADRRLAPVDPRHIRAWRFWAARHSRGHPGAGHVRDSDSVFCFQPGLLSLYCGHAPHRSDPLRRY